MTPSKSETPAQETVWKLRLYVLGNPPRSAKARDNLQKICGHRLGAGFQIELVDLQESPERARADQILAVPTTMRVAPPPVCKIIGDLSDEDKVVSILELE